MQLGEGCCTTSAEKEPRWANPRRLQADHAFPSSSLGIFVFLVKDRSQMQLQARWLLTNTLRHRHPHEPTVYMWWWWLGEVFEGKDQSLLNQSGIFDTKRVLMYRTLQCERKKFPQPSDQNVIRFKVGIPFHFGRQTHLIFLHPGVFLAEGSATSMEDSTTTQCKPGTCKSYGSDTPRGMDLCIHES